MPVEVKNLRIKVNVNGSKTEDTTLKRKESWSSNEVINAIEQVIKSNNER